MTTEAAPIAPAGCDKNAIDRGELLNRLLVASGRHDQTAFARFYQLTSPWIYALMERRTGAVAPAQEATSLVYVATWQRAASFTPQDQSALAWLTALAYDPKTVPMPVS